MKAVFKRTVPYCGDALNLPVASADEAVPFYEKIMGFQLVSRNDEPVKSAVLARDDIRIGLAENGGDPTQDGCFFEVDNAETAFAELKANGFDKEAPDYSTQKFGTTSFKCFFVVAPDGLCYMLGEKLG